MPKTNSKSYRFSFGPWNIHEGADPFGPTVRQPLAFAKKLKLYKKLGFDGVQFHDDDAVPDLDKQLAGPGHSEGRPRTGAGCSTDEGLVAEFVAPRLWEDPRTIDGGYTANDPDCRQVRHRAPAAGRRHRRRPGHRPASCSGWPAKAPTSARRRTPARPTSGCSTAINEMLATRPADPHRHRAQAQRADGPRLHPHDRPRPGAGLRCRTIPSRVGGLIETAHAMLAGLDPSDEMAFALSPQEAVERPPQRPERPEVRRGQDLRRGQPPRGVQPGARARRGRLSPQNGEFVGLDVKAMRTQKQEKNTGPPGQQQAVLRAAAGEGPHFRPQGRGRVHQGTAITRAWSGMVIEHLLAVK